MKTRKKIILIFLLLILAIISVSFYFLNIKPFLINDDRDVHGCLGPAGYSWNEEVGACIRSFEMTSDIMKAVGLAVESIGRGYALTVVSFNSYEEVGAYDIVFERGEMRERKTVYIRGWKVVPAPTQSN